MRVRSLDGIARVDDKRCPLGDGGVVDGAVVGENGDAVERRQRDDSDGTNGSVSVTCAPCAWSRPMTSSEGDSRSSFTISATRGELTGTTVWMEEA